MTNGYNFTERVRRVLHVARQEAHALHHEYVGSEHMLLALIAEGEGVATAVLQTMDVDLQKLRDNVLMAVKSGSAAQATGPDLPYTSRAKKVLELSMSEARELSHGYVGTEHLLLALIREERGIAAQMLVAAGASLPKVRAEVVRLLGTVPEERRQRSGENSSAQQKVSKPVASIEVLVQFSDGTQEKRVFTSTAAAMEHLVNFHIH
jgi:ATP-dependent Clp protease ATP-binding subunit ClpC